MTRRGWYGEKYRHKMASKGIKTNMKRDFKHKFTRFEVDEQHGFADPPYTRIVIYDNITGEVVHDSDGNRLDFDNYDDALDYIKDSYEGGLEEVVDLKDISGKFGMYKGTPEYNMLMGLIEDEWQEYLDYLAKHGVSLEYDMHNDVFVAKNMTGQAGGQLKQTAFKMAKIDFCRKANHDKAGFNDPVPILTVPPIIKVQPKTYNQIENTNDELPMHIKNKLKTFKTGKKSKPIQHTGAIITDGERYLIIDTQGYDSPRYKSRIQLEKENKPLRWS